MNKTTIEWTDYTWNPVTGCHKVSPGCKNCYAETLTNRFAKVWGVESFREVVMHEDRLSEPEKNKKKWAGKKVFVCSMSDLFHEDVPFDFIAKVYGAMVKMPDTTFQILTKRPARALAFHNYMKYLIDSLHQEPIYKILKNTGAFIDHTTKWPLPNMWIGTSCENHETANERIPYLLQIPAAVRFLSCEPLLGPINLTADCISCEGYGFRNDGNENIDDGYYDCLRCGGTGKSIYPVDWVIVGGESGHGARLMHPDWVRSLRDQCARALVPFFFKQWGEWAPGSEYGPEVMCLNTDKKHHLFDVPLTSNLQMTSLQSMYRAGKSKSGNLLDGKQHLNFPLANGQIG